MQTVGILGGGAWGTALAVVAARAGKTVTLWARDLGTVAAVNEHRANAAYLPGIELAASIVATGNIAAAATAGCCARPR